MKINIMTGIVLLINNLAFAQGVTNGPGGMKPEYFNITSFIGGLLLGIVATYFFSKNKFKK